MRLERRDRGAADMRVALRLVTCERHARHLALPSPIRDVRTLRTLALLDLESHPPSAAIDCVTVVIDPTPGRVLQHRLFTRAHPTPEQLSTLLARLGALMGRDRIGAPARVDSDRPGAFEMRSFATDHEHHAPDHDDHCSRLRAEGASAFAEAPADRRSLGGGWSASLAGARGEHRRAAAGDRKDRGEFHGEDPASSAASALNVVSALRRCRQPVPARVAVDAGRPVRVTTDRRSFAGGAVLQSAGPWRTSGYWWNSSCLKFQGSRLKLQTSDLRLQTSRVTGPLPPLPPPWDRDEWDVALSDGAVYRIFRDRETDGWFIDAIAD